MAWTDGADQTTGTVITSTIWNNYLGTAGSIQKTAPAVVTTAGDIVYATGDNAIARLGVGSARQTLQTNAAANAPEWVASPQSLLDAKGEILGASAANTLGALAAGTNGYLLTADSSETLGVKWAAAAGGGSWTLEAADTTERGFTNSSDAQLFQITSLNIAAAKPLKIFAQIYGTVNQAGWTSSPTFYVRGFNGTQIANFGPQFLADGGKTYLWQFELTWGPRETVSGREYGYINMVLGSSQRDTGNPSGAFGAGSSSSSRVQAQPSNSSVPTTSTITSIEFGTIGYSTDQFYCKNVFVYSLAVS